MHLSDLHLVFMLAQGVGFGLLLSLVTLECMARAQAWRETHPPEGAIRPRGPSEAIDVQWTEVGRSA